MRCPNKKVHGTSYYSREMQRLYVRHTEGKKRTWVAVGWFCDPNYKPPGWGTQVGCGTVAFDDPPRIVLPKVEDDSEE